jgi:hypothetical protein
MSGDNPLSANYRVKNWLAALDDFRNWLIREAA